jgi:hypothetical protein
MLKCLSHFLRKVTFLIDCEVPHLVHFHASLSIESFLNFIGMQTLHFLHNFLFVKVKHHKYKDLKRSSSHIDQILDNQPKHT